MNHKQSLLGEGKVYTVEEALTLLKNMSDFEDESTSESEIGGDSSDSSVYIPEQQYQVRTDSNIQALLPKETVNQNATKCAQLADETATTSGEEHVASPPKVSKVKEISTKGQKAAPKLVGNHNATKCALLADETATTSGEEHVASPQKYLELKKYLQRAKKAAPKLVGNQNATKHALLADETVTTSGEESVASPPKVSKVKEISAKGQKAASKLVAKKRVIPQKASTLHDEGAMASDSDLDGEDYYIVEDDNESASSEYVPCVNYPNDKVYPEDEKNGWVRLEEDTGPPNIYRFEGSCQNYMVLNDYTPGAVFDEFLKIEYGQY